MFNAKSRAAKTKNLEILTNAVDLKNKEKENRTKNRTMLKAV